MKIQRDILKGISIDWYHFRPLLILAGQSLSLALQVLYQDLIHATDDLQNFLNMYLDDFNNYILAYAELFYTNEDMVVVLKKNLKRSVDCIKRDLLKDTIWDPP